MTTFRDSVRKYYTLYRRDGYKANTALAYARHAARYGYVEDFDCRIITNLQRRKHKVLPGYVGDKVRYELGNGLYAIVEMEYDQHYDTPWEDSDAHGVVSDWEHRGEANGRWLLSQDGNSYRYYDWRETLEIAKRDGWGLGDPMDAVRKNYDYLHAWCNDRWSYVGLIVELYDADDELIEEDSCWGYESYCEDYLCSEARSWLTGMVKRYRAARREARRQERINNRFRDAMECGV